MIHALRLPDQAPRAADALTHYALPLTTAHLPSFCFCFGCANSAAESWVAFWVFVIFLPIRPGMRMTQGAHFAGQGKARHRLRRASRPSRGLFFLFFFFFFFSLVLYWWIPTAAIPGVLNEFHFSEA